MSKTSAGALCILTAAIWGGGFIATDRAISVFPPFLFLSLRFIGAALICWIFMTVTRRKISKDAWKTGIASGVFLYLAFAFQTFGLQLTETGMNSFLTSVNVILVPYLAWMLYRQKPDGKIIGCSLMCLTGIGFLCFANGSFSFRLGDLLSLICAVFFALQIVVLDKAGQTDAWSINTVQLTVAGLLSLPFNVFGSFWPSAISMDAWTGVVYSILFSTFLCYLFQTIAQQHISPSAASIFLCTESLWANIFGFLILHEPKTGWMIFGGLLIFFSVVLLEMPAISFKKVRNLS